MSRHLLLAAPFEAFSADAMTLMFKGELTPYVEKILFELHLVAVKVTAEQIDVTTSSAAFSQCVVFK